MKITVFLILITVAVTYSGSEGEEIIDADVSDSDGAQPLDANDYNSSGEEAQIEEKEKSECKTSHA